MIAEKIGLPELLAGLAEEAAELAQAALKLRRVYDGKNPTPCTLEDAQNHLLEEVADVNLYLAQMDINYKTVDDIAMQKYERWVQRLSGGTQ